MSETTYRPIDEMTFKEASVELEQIVRSLEGGELELEEQRVRVLLDATDENAPVTDTASAPSTAYINE